jgi:exosortase D (VPLPA-CTERM-specific)
MASKLKTAHLFPLISLAILTIALLWSYAPVLIDLFTRVAVDEDYSYGLLLPLVSAYIVYLKWPQIHSMQRQSSWLGLPVIALGFCLYIAGKLAADYYTPPLSFIIVLVGLLLTLGGGALVRLLAFPLILLVFMIPLPSVLTGKLTLPLQLVSSHLAAIFLRGLGYPLVLQGNVIDLGVRQLQVVSACSGLRYILALLALGMIFCFFYQRRFWKVVVLLISLVPAAIVANAFRVALMGIYPALQEGFLHSFSGWLIFIFCLAFLVFLNAILNHFEPELKTRTTADSQAEPEGPPARIVSTSIPALVAGLIMIILGGTLVNTVGSPQRVPLEQSFNHFPLALGPWQGQRTYMDPKIFERTDADTYFDADYSSPGQQSVSFYIAYYEKASGGGLGHNPGSCMTGSGWKTIESGSTRVGPNLPANYLLLERQGVRLLVYWWNIHQGQWLALSDARFYKLHTIYNSLRRHRTDWALVRLVTPVANDVESARQRLNAFAHLVIPVLPQFIRE